MMKRIFFSLFLLLAVTAANGQVGLYDDMCDPLQAVFCDYVGSASSQNVISEGDGKYVGTLIDGRIYGWGMIVTGDGTMSIGQFRNGKCIFGISMDDEIAKVGGEEHYVIYDLSTGGIIRQCSRYGEAQLVYPLVSEGDKVSPYSFRKVSYANGDVYIGELYEGKRHGYGMYCWADGEVWYGRYQGGYRNGFGVLIKADNHLYYGKWVGDRKVDE
jgi:hypothetical protein